MIAKQRVNRVVPHVPLARPEHRSLTDTPIRTSACYRHHNKLSDA